METQDTPIVSATQKSTTGVQDTQQVNPIQRKLNKILESRIENDKDLVESLKSLSVYFPQNNIRTRRNLRSEIEKRSLLLNEEFLNAFQTVKEQLDAICNDISAMSDCCENMTTRLKQVKDSTNELISKTTSLQSEKREMEQKYTLVTAFNERFQLSNDEINALCSKKENFLHKDFFKVLEKVQKIHSDCKVLLRTNQQTLGLEVMEQMSLNQEAAYERLYRWTQNESRLLCNDLVEISDMFSQAMVVLKQRPILFKYTLDEYCNSRRNAIVKLFIDALTKGQGSTKPIELNSHDPLRYIGDMLAWIHQNTATEHEYLRSLFRKMTDDFNVEVHLKLNLGIIMEGVCRSLKIRVEQVLVSQRDTILYKISNVLKFYHYTIGLRVNENSALIQTLEELFSLSYKMFLNSLSIHATRLLEKIEPPNLDLAPTAEFRSTLSLIKDLFDSHNTSVVPLNSRKEDYNQILDCVLDPMLQMSSLSAIKLSIIEMAVYMVNCIYTIHSMLSLYEYIDAKLEKLDAQIEAHMDTLVNEQAYFVLSKTDMLEVYKAVQIHDASEGPLVNKLGMDSVALKAAMSKFDVYLAVPDSLIVPQYNYIFSSNIRTQLKTKSVKLVCDAYNLIYKAITNPANGYANSTSIVPRTPDQVEKLLK